MELGRQDIYQHQCNDDNPEIFICSVLLQILGMAAFCLGLWLNFEICKRKEKCNKTEKINDIPGVNDSAAHTFIMKIDAQVFYPIGRFPKKVVTGQPFKAVKQKEAQENRDNKCGDLVVGEGRGKDPD